MKTKKNLEKEELVNQVFCSLPSIPERPVEEFIDSNRLSLIRYNEKKWVNKTILHYYFMNNKPEWIGEDNQKRAVKEAFDTWKSLGIGLEFREVNDPTEAEIKIGFESGGSWSYVGRDCIDFEPNPEKRTMNFGWDLTTEYGKDTALHEIGHALGFPHEHQNPNAGIIWNETAVYDYFGSAPNYWDRDKTYYNVIRKISSAEVEGSLWDKDSIMHYEFNAGLIINPVEYQTRPLIPKIGLSQIDIDEVKKFYPDSQETQTQELKPFISKLINIKPSEQLDFIIKPNRTRTYTIQTFGNLDTVMVLFEDIRGNSVYINGDDDSGYNYNSKIIIRLLKNHTYYLRIRLYYSADSGNGAVMIW